MKITLINSGALTWNWMQRPEKNEKVGNQHGISDEQNKIKYKMKLK